MKYNFYILLLSVGLTNLSAQTADLLASISTEMEHFNQVATQTKQNEHYQPYIISVVKFIDKSNS